ncbi:MAG: polysaccharide pyruvyl transferase family protein [Pseudonocardiaceae bacterium]
MMRGRKRNMVITGVTSCENRGVEALVASIAAQLHQTGPYDVTVLTQTASTDRAQLAPWNVECVADPFVVSTAWEHARPPETPERAEARSAALITAADLVVATGGDLYTSSYGVSTPYLSAPAAAQRSGVPVAMLAHSVGPFTASEDALAWTKIALRCEVLTTRESRSQRYVIDDLGLPAAKVTLAADPAFLLPAAPQWRVEEILSTVGIETGQPYACIAPSKGIVRFRRLDEAAHTHALSHLIDHLLSRFHLPVLLIPHVHDSRPHNDDRVLVAELARDRAHPDVHPVLGPLSATEYKGIAAKSSLVVAERLHAAIGALSAGVPTAAIGYSQKFLGVFADTYGDAVPLDHVHLDVETLVADERAGARLVAGLHTQAMSQALSTNLPTVVHRAQLNFTLLLAVMGALRS